MSTFENYLASGKLPPTSTKYDKHRLFSVFTGTMDEGGPLTAHAKIPLPKLPTTLVVDL